MTSNVFGFHNAISAGDGTNATLADFTSFLDSGGSFYLGGNSSGATNPTDGYFAWNNTDKSLLISGSKVNVEVDKFFLGNTDTQFISGSNGNIKISGDVEFEGKTSNGATIFYDDFSGNLTANETFTTSDTPKVDGTGVGYHIYQNNGEKSFVTGQGEFSGRIAEFGDANDNDEIWMSSNKLIPFNENSLYELEVRYKIAAANMSIPKVYAGITAYAADGTTKVNAIAANSFSSQHYFAASASTTLTDGTDWIIKKGFFKGTASSGNGGAHNSDTDPGTIHQGALNGYITPVFIANFNDQAGTVQLDYIKITETGGGGSTRISGDSIKTGVLKSNNLSADSGSEFRLDEGTLKLGGTSNPGFEVTKEGFVTATNIVESSVIVEPPNSASYFEYYDESGGSTNDSTRLILDGSTGGLVTMNMSLAVAPTYVIRDIQFPSNAGSNEVAKLELTVIANGVEFDNEAVASGYAEYVSLLSYAESPS